MRIQKRPTFRATAGITFDSWAAGCEAVRQIVQAKLWPANLRILDPVEAGRAAGLDGAQALVIVSFESAELSQRHSITEAVAIARAAGGHVDDDEVRRRRRRRHARRAAVARWAHGATRSSACSSASTRPSALSPTRSRPPSPGTAGPNFDADRPCADDRRRCARCSASITRCRAGSRTCTPTAPRRTTRGAASAGRARRSRCGRRSRRPRTRSWSTPVER